MAADAFVFTLLAAVLGELDRLNTEHRNSDVREKAKAVITRIKGRRLQGSLSAGVTVDKTITVRACHSEPDMTRTLTWLDGDVQDDRILAGVIALQAERPSSRVVLVTGDINLQTRLMLPWSRPRRLPNNRLQPTATDPILSRRG